MNRREVLKSIGASVASAGLPAIAHAGQKPPVADVGDLFREDWMFLTDHYAEGMGDNLHYMFRKPLVLVSRRNRLGQSAAPLRSRFNCDYELLYSFGSMEVIKSGMDCTIVLGPFARMMLSQFTGRDFRLDSLKVSRGAIFQIP